MCLVALFFQPVVDVAGERRGEGNPDLLAEPRFQEHLPLLQVGPNKNEANANSQKRQVGPGPEDPAFIFRGK